MILDSFTIKSSRSAGELKLSEPKPPGLSYIVEYCRVTLKDRDIATSSTQVYCPADIIVLFDDMAANWQGWEGEKQLSTVDSNLALSCTSNDLGQVAMKVTLKSGPYEDDWCVQAVIRVEARQLKQLAMQLREFFHLQNAS